jgi:WD40 repeat protein
LGNLIPAPLPVALPPRVTVSPDGRYVASATLPGPIDLFDLASGTRDQLVGHAEDVSALAFSRDGRTLVSGDWGGVIKQWNVPERRSVAALVDPAAVVGCAVQAAAISPDGKTLATGSADRSITLWDMEARRPLPLPPGHRGPVWTLAFSPDGRTLASGGNDRTVRLWSVPLRREVGTLRWFGEDSGWAITLVAFSPDGNNLAVLTRNGNLTVLRAANFEQAEGAER